jgi:hypothetical protein
MNFFHQGAPDCSYFAAAAPDALRAAGFFAGFFAADFAAGFLVLFFLVFTAMTIVNLHWFLIVGA